MIMHLYFSICVDVRLDGFGIYFFYYREWAWTGSTLSHIDPLKVSSGV